MQIFIGISLEVVMVVGIQVVVYWLVTCCSLVGGNTLLEECQSAFDPEDCNSWFPQDAGVHLQVDTASQPKRLQFEVITGIQYAKVLYRV